MKRPTDDFWRQLSLLDQKLGSISYYELLGVQATAELDAIRGSYERQVRVVHPDRHAREADDTRKQCLTRIYARIGEAFRILSHPQRRAEYDRDLGTGKLRYEKSRNDSAPRPQQADPHHPQAKSLFEQAKSLLDQNDKKAARAKLQLAKQYQPDSKAIAEAIAECEGTKKTAPEPEPEPEPEPTLTPQTRAHVRVPMGKSIQVSCQAWQHVTNLYMQNISRGGMLLRCDEVVPLGSILELSLGAPDGKTIELPSEVVRHILPSQEGERPGMGIRFLLIPEPVRDSFESVLRFAGVKAEGTTQPAPTAQAQAPAPAAAVAPPLVDTGAADAIARAQALIEAGDHRKAGKLMQGIVRTYPDNKALRATFHLAAGLMARERGLDERAHSHFERALRFDSDSPLILRHLREDSK